MQKQSLLKYYRYMPRQRQVELKRFIYNIQITTKYQNILSLYYIDLWHLILSYHITYSVNGPLERKVLVSKFLSSHIFLHTLPSFLPTFCKGQKRKRKISSYFAISTRTLHCLIYISLYM